MRSPEASPDKGERSRDWALRHSNINLGGENETKEIGNGEFRRAWYFGNQAEKMF